MSKKYYNSKVRLSQFRTGDLVLKRALGPSIGVFGQTWEGPYQVAQSMTNGAYELEDLDNKSAQYPWNAANLKLYYR
ncbi:hypothetical protein ACS0TY_003039 [Phlomoides rotata]